MLVHSVGLYGTSLRRRIVELSGTPASRGTRRACVRVLAAADPRYRRGLKLCSRIEVSAIRLLFLAGHDLSERDGGACR